MVLGAQEVCALLRPHALEAPMEGQVPGLWNHTAPGCSSKILGPGPRCHFKTDSETHRANPLELGVILSLRLTDRLEFHWLSAQLLIYF